MSSSEDDFPVPAAKRRRLSRRGIPSDEEDSGEIPCVAPKIKKSSRINKTTRNALRPAAAAPSAASPVKRPRGRPRKDPNALEQPQRAKPSEGPKPPKEPKPKKPKHRVVVYDQVGDVQDYTATQAPAEQPWAVRGAVWQKSNKQPLGHDKSDSTKAPGSSQSRDAPPPLTQVPDHTGVGKRPVANVSARSARHLSTEDFSMDDEEDAAFETPGQAKKKQAQSPPSRREQSPLKESPSRGNARPLPKAPAQVDKSPYGQGVNEGLLTEDLSELSDFDPRASGVSKSSREPEVSRAGQPCKPEAQSGADDFGLENIGRDHEHVVQLHDPDLSTAKVAIGAVGPHQQEQAPHGDSSATEYDDLDIDMELADLPSDAFEFSLSSDVQQENAPGNATKGNAVIEISSSPAASRRTAAVPQVNLQQRTLFGDPASQQQQAVQGPRQLSFVKDIPPEPPTHHKLNTEALGTYIYPTNLGTIREYQWNIVNKGLFANTLVALPTGLGKTFIAATIMLNWFRWTVDAQIVFVAPTRPLVSQQVEACFGIAGIPKSKTSFMTGGVNKSIRADEWSSKRVFFVTPQIFENDLGNGLADPKRIVLLVVDEAHRAKGNYSYVKVVKLLQRYNESFRILALTATPGADIKSVQEVVNSLNISKIEIRTEFSIDIRQYTYERQKDVLVFQRSEEMELIMSLFAKALQPAMDKLKSQNAYWSADPMMITAYGMMQARKRWVASAGSQQANPGLKAMVQALFQFLSQMGNPIELMKFHGLGPFYHSMVNIRNAARESNSKYMKMLLDNNHFQQMMDKLRFWVNNPAFVGHPKLERLQQIVLNHFLDADQGKAEKAASKTRVMIFAQYRSSAEEIVRVLKRHGDMLKPHLFIGQAASTTSEGMDQKTQLKVIEQFKEGSYNILVATSIGEEGLDIGEIDLILCYDSSASPIRMLQRMGRTGRKRAGRIILLLMDGKEAQDYHKAVKGYEDMQKLIADGKWFDFHDDLSRRIVPREIKPQAERKVIEMPEENINAGISEPRKRGRPTKAAPKKFNMPEGTMTGFLMASRIGEDGRVSMPARDKRAGRKAETKFLVEVPAVGDVVLKEDEAGKLRQQYQNVRDSAFSDAEIEAPKASSHVSEQRSLRPTAKVEHGSATRSFVKIMAAMSRIAREDTRHPCEVVTESDCEEANGSDIDFLSEQAISTEGKKKRSAKSKPATAKAITKAKAPKPAKAAVTLAPPKSKPFKVPQMTSAGSSASAAHGAARRGAGSARATPKGRVTKSRLVRDEEVDEGAAEGQSSSPPPTDPRFALPTQGEWLGSDTSGEDAPEEEPSSDLRDFIAASDEVVAELPSSIPLTMPPPKRKRLNRRRPALDAIFDDASEDDEEAPDSSGNGTTSARRQRRVVVPSSS